MESNTSIQIQTAVGILPNEADLAIVSIDEYGTPGTLNQLVISTYGYFEKDLPNQEKLRSGFYALTQPNRKPIIFIVTGVSPKVKQNLRANLWAAFAEFRGWLQDKTVWIPLMGLTSGLVSLEESHQIITQNIKRLIEEYNVRAKFDIYVPDDGEGRKFVSQIKDIFPENLMATDQQISDFLNSVERNFYLAGSFWNGDDQLDRFLDEGIWEKGFGDQTYSNIINNVKVNDVIIIKSSFARDEVSYLRVKAFGVVLENPQDGIRLMVDWRIDGLSFDIDGLGFYRDTIRMANKDDVRTVLEHVPYSFWQSLGSKISKPAAKPNSIAGLISDSDRGVDYLNITKDVTAFAKVIAAKSFDPPLAVALFGKWGSGKSFFMRELKEQIVKLSDMGLEDFYCKGIAHIHFNAWSYIDANLWASIVTRIFEGLQEYISNDDKAKFEKREIEAKLTKQLNITQEELKKLEGQKDSLAEQIKILNEDKTKIETKLNRKIQQIKSNTLAKALATLNERFNVKERIEKSLDGNESYKKSIKELKKLVPEQYWNDPEKIYEEAKSASTFLKHLIYGKQRWVNLLWLAGIILLVLAVPTFVNWITNVTANTNFSLSAGTLYAISICAPVLIKGIDTYKRLQPSISAFWKIKMDYETEKNKAISEHEQKEKALKLEIEKRVSDIASINQQVKQAEGLKAGLEYKLEHAKSTQALYSFIERRVNSEDYQKHLGIVSVIRKDFDILSALCNDHKSEYVTAEDRKKFLSHFDKPLERIVLYIDDLDRCPEDIVVQVIDAVNLLMAYPLFIVIVGVDPVWIKNALIKKHASQFAGYLDGDKSGVQLEKIDPAFYLEKIFQVPFHLKDASSDNVRTMVKNLAQYRSASRILDAGTNGLPVNERKTGKDGNEKTDIGDTDSTKPAGSKNDGNALVNINSPVNQPNDKPEAIVISEIETGLLQDIAGIIGENPRAIKRFINTYRIIKAHEDFSYDEKTAKNELLVTMFLLALPISNYRKLMKSFEDYFNNPEIPFATLQTYLVDTEVAEDLNKLFNNPDRQVTERESFEILKDQPVESFHRHNLFIRRFTFKNI